MEARITFNERCRIEEMARRNMCNQQMANELGRHHSTVALEVERGGGRTSYTAKKGDEVMKEYRKRAIENALCAKQQLSLLREKVTVLQATSAKDQLSEILEHLRTITENLGKFYERLT